jgi:hypothetical protein
MILAGTSTGMSVYWNRAWHDFDVKLPVTSIARVSKDVIAVGMGNGSRSDAVYLGFRILRGPPFYALRMQQYFVTPTAMTIGRSSSVITPRDTTVVLSVGNGKSVAAGLIAKDSLLPLRDLKIPAYAFGVENPKCADMLLFKDSTLFAGGNDIGPMTGKGSLLELVKDSLTMIKRLNVTALAQGMFFEVAPQELVVGTADTGVLLHNPATNGWSSLGGPAKEAINDVVVLRPQIGWSDLLLCAVNSGVFSNGGRTATWTAVGRIPRAPLCLAGMGAFVSGNMSGDLLAGTAAGVYLYAEQTIAVDRPAIAQERRIAHAVTVENNVAHFTFAAPPARGMNIAVHTASGRLCASAGTAGPSANLRLDAKGIFYYTIRAGEKNQSGGVIANVK